MTGQDKRRYKTLLLCESGKLFDCISGFLARPELNLARCLLVHLLSYMLNAEGLNVTLCRQGFSPTVGSLWKGLEYVHDN